MQSDIVVVGAGLAGALMAAVLTRAGLSVVVVDRHATYPSDFRAEQLVGSQTVALRRLGLLEGLVGQTPVVPSATAACYGKIIDSTRDAHYGLRYEDMVNAARSLATGAKFIRGRVAQVVTGPDTQTVHLADETRLQAQLVVLATGPNCGDLLSSLGIQQTTVSDNHSLSFGFDVNTTDRRILVYYGEQAGDGMDYLTVFPIGDTMRGNLFCYLDPSHPWVRSFKLDPKAALLGVMPSLEQTIGPFAIVGKVQVRPISIQRANTVGRQPGVVLIGDAFQTSCPAAGTGIGRILADVEALRRLVPVWLATPGMGANKIAQFYGDPAKRQFDAKAIRYSQHRRALCTRTTLGWKMYRKQHYLRRRAQGMVSGAVQREMSRIISASTALLTFLLG